LFIPDLGVLKKCLALFCVIAKCAIGIVPSFLSSLQRLQPYFGTLWIRNEILIHSVLFILFIHSTSP
jgi:hypothetical protein